VTSVETAYLSVGSNIRVTAIPGDARDRDHAVVVRGYATHYPVLGLYMSAADALRLSGELIDAVRAGQGRAAKTPEQSAGSADTNLVARGAAGLPPEVAA